MADDTTQARKYFGNAAHFIGASHCRFHLATQIGGIVVSTVGDYFPNGDVMKPSTIGFNRTFETMVFLVRGACECGCGLPLIDGEEIDFAAYNSAADANAGHEAMCVKYERSSLETPGRTET